MDTRFRAVGVCLPLFVTAAAGAQLADFDALSEGFAGTSLTTGGITFFDPVHFFGEAAPFAVENVGGILPTFPDLAPHFSSPNVLTLAGFISGPTGWLMGRIEQIKMTTGNVENEARMDLFFDAGPMYAGTALRLDALLAGQVVAGDSFTIAGAEPGRGWAELAISGAAFDTLRLYAVGAPGNPEGDGFLGCLDNVQIIPAPGVSALAAVGAVGLARRRRRES